MGKKKKKNSSEVPRCQSLVIPLCILKSSHEVKNKRSQESVSQQRRRITVTVRRVNSLQITPLSPPPPHQPLFKPISLLLLPPSLPPSLVSKHDTTQERWSVGAISRAKFGGAAAVVAAGPFHTLILRRMCNYTAAGGWCGFSRDQKKKKKKALMNMSMRSCLGSIGASTEKVKLRRVYSLWGKTTARDGDILTLAYIL